MYDAIVIGVGGMGSAALYHLAQRGVAVLGLEQFPIGHDRGSSHGRTRIIRKAYFEHPDYVPLLRRSYELWSELEARSGSKLFERTGMVLFGRPEGVVLAGAGRAAREHYLDVVELSTEAARQRFPGFLPGRGMTALFEADAGFLHVEACVRTHAELAVAHGAVIRTGETVTAWSSEGSSVTVTAGNETYSARYLVICGGAWANRLLKSLKLPLVVRRKVVFWFDADRATYGVEHGCPVFAFDTDDGFFYGSPMLDDDGVKVAEHTGGMVVDHPDQLDRTLFPEDLPRVQRFVTEFMPQAGSTVTRHSVCMYTMTPDEHFIIDRHLNFANVCFAAGFSGHGFKFAPIVGSILADFVVKGRTDEPIGFLAALRRAIQAEPRP